MEGFLSKQERQELLYELRLERNAKFSDRIKCILLLDSGKSYQEISEFLFLSSNSVRQYKYRYDTGGLKELLTNKYVGNCCCLETRDLEELAFHLEDNLYQTVMAIKDYVKAKYGVAYTISGLRHLLIRLGFVYKKPKCVPGKADAKEQERFLKGLKNKLNCNSNTAVYFADGTHPQHNTQISYGWIKKGQNKEVKTNTGRQRININGVMNAHDPTDVLIDESDSINAQSTIRMLKGLEKNNVKKEKIYVVVDNARYYRCALVKEYLDTSKIELLFLPPYSPNLNLIERLWRLLKKTVLYNRYFETYEEFRKTVLSFFKNIKRYRAELKTLMTLKFHIAA